MFHLTDCVHSHRLLLYPPNPPTHPPTPNSPQPLLPSQTPSVFQVSPPVEAMGEEEEEEEGEEEEEEEERRRRRTMGLPSINPFLS